VIGRHPPELAESEGDESYYRLFRQARATTTTRDPLVRFAFVVVGFLSENLRLVL